MCADEEAVFSRLTLHRLSVKKSVLDVSVRDFSLCKLASCTKKHHRV